MAILLLIASLLFAQDAATTATVSGRVTMDDSSALPMVTTFRGPAVQVGLLVTLPDGGSRIGEAAMSPDGSFQLQLRVAAGKGSFTVTASRLPLGYYVKSMSHGAVDLLRSPLNITPASASLPVQLVLTKAPPAGAAAGVRLLGRVTNWTSNAPSLVVSLQSSQPDANGVPVLRLATTNLKPDGTFEFSGVPAGRYRGFSPADSRTDLVGFEVTATAAKTLDITLPDPNVPSIIITSDPFAQPGGIIRGSGAVVAGPRTPLQAPAGSALVSIAQSGRYNPGWYEGALNYYRIERAGEILQEKRLEANTALTFTLMPGNYDLRGYSRSCNGNCGRLDAPEILCAVPLTVVAGQTLYAERVMQNGTCTIQFNAPPVP
jgi:hypothetical protein